MPKLHWTDDLDAPNKPGDIPINGLPHKVQISDANIAQAAKRGGDAFFTATLYTNYEGTRYILTIVP